VRGSDDGARVRVVEDDMPPERQILRDFEKKRSSPFLKGSPKRQERKQRKRGGRARGFGKREKKMPGFWGRKQWIEKDKGGERGMEGGNLSRFYQVLGGGVTGNAAGKRKRYEKWKGGVKKIYVRGGTG